MDFVVKENCSLRRDFKRYAEGDVLSGLSKAELKRYKHVIEPHTDGMDDAVEAAPEPDAEVEAEVEAAPRKRRRAVASDG